jgi:large subunit ribosomal protein L11
LTIVYGEKISFVKLALAAGKATPAPPVGPALGQHGVNIAGLRNIMQEHQSGFNYSSKITII